VFGGETDEVAIPAEESKLILKTIAEGEWKVGMHRPRIGAPTPYAMQMFQQLRLTAQDGWKEPEIPQQMPGGAPADFVAIQKEAFVKWLGGAGKNYVIKKIVMKPAKNEKPSR
jgi:hypothetical protein